MTNEETPVDNSVETVVEDQTQEPKADTGELDSLKADKEKLEAELGGLKRDLKKATKSKKEDGKKEEPNDALLQRMERQTFKQAEITHEDDKELARDTAEKWNMDIDEVLDDEDFKAKLERQQSKRANTEASSNIRGSGSGSEAKNSPEHYIAKGQPASKEDIPNADVRRKVNRAFYEHSKPNSGKMKFYND